ncbi:MAG TPA: hypothetical protein VN238_03245, partial [Solirubrobacteraceae bacterium]|nr:hypothetical protein [Solirubrobacteraceae bacterium]
MSDISSTSRQYAERLRPGTHDLDNAELRRVYGLSRITAKARGEIAAGLRRAGLEVLTDPALEPLVVRKVARQPAPARPERPRQIAPRPAGPRTPWWKRRPAIAAAVVAVLLLLVGALSDSDQQPESAQAVPETTARTAPETTPAEPPAEAAAVFADAEQAVEDGDFTGAVRIARALGRDDADRVRRKISRVLARDVRRALRTGSRRRASSILARADGYPATPQIRAARASYRAAKARAAERARQRR